MKIDARCLQRLGKASEQFVVGAEFFWILRVRGIIMREHARERLYDEDAHRALSVGRDLTKARRIVGKQFFLAKIWLLIEYIGRIIALALAAQRVMRKVHIHEIDPVDRLPIDDLFALDIAAFVSQPCETFAERAFFPELFRYGSELFQSDELGISPHQFIHARLLHIRVMAHDAARPLRLFRHGFFRHQMPRKTQVVSFAPVGVLFGKTLFELFSRAVIVVGTRLFIISDVEKQLFAALFDVVALFPQNTLA